MINVVPCGVNDRTGGVNKVGRVIRVVIGVESPLGDFASGAAAVSDVEIPEHDERLVGETGVEFPDQGCHGVVAQGIEATAAFEVEVDEGQVLR